MTTTKMFGSKAVLALGHVAGLIDMVALPIWVGVLIQHYGYSPERAGVTVTCFLFAVLVSSVFFASRFNALPRRIFASGGFAIGALCFYYLGSQRESGPASFGEFAVLHAIAGLGVGCALSFVHGAMGRTPNPHRMFGMGHLALGVFALFFLSLVPPTIQTAGAATLFAILSGVMSAAALLMAVGFPTIRNSSATEVVADEGNDIRIPRVAWAIIFMVTCLTLNQSMMLSFIERIGADRGFGVERVNMALLALGFVNLFPGGLAALLQQRLSPMLVGVGGLTGQALLAMTLGYATSYPPYAVAASLFVSMAIFTHVFLFGLLSKLDRSGRAVAATPAMIMLGASIGPALGGWIVQSIGYEGLGWAAAAIACVGFGLAFQVARQLRTTAVYPLCAEAQA